MRVLVFGAGAIGGYLGGLLLVGGVDVTLLVRPSVAQRLDREGLTLTDFHHNTLTVEGEVPYVVDLDACSEPFDVVLLTVKCTGVEEAARALAGHLGPETLVVCLQNGVGSDQTVGRFVPPEQVVSGIVGFNVATLEGGRLHRGTEGELHLQEHPALAPLILAWNRTGLPVETVADFAPVAWGKLLLNLNNAVNALAGVPLVEELSQKPYRRVLAACMSELLRALRAAGVKPARLTRVPPFLLPWVLRLPDWLFRLVARRMLAIDPLARSSMWDDLERGRPTEIAYLNLKVVELAHSRGLSAPVNQAVSHLVRQAEGSGSPGMNGRELLEQTLG